MPDAPPAGVGNAPRARSVATPIPMVPRRNRGARLERPDRPRGPESTPSEGRVTPPTALSDAPPATYPLWNAPFFLFPDCGTTARRGRLLPPLRPLAHES